MFCVSEVGMQRGVVGLVVLVLWVLACPAHGSGAGVDFATSPVITNKGSTANLTLVRQDNTTQLDVSWSTTAASAMGASVSATANGS